MKIEWTIPARQDLRRIDREQAIFILHSLAHYAATGEGDAKPLNGSKEFRLRAGDWRVRFDQSPTGAIRVLHVKHRREAYR
jgi:mRNA-degrading endonuclease RelE of RelBE toxin-antitoxin system